MHGQVGPREGKEELYPVLTSHSAVLSNVLAVVPDWAVAF